MSFLVIPSASLSFDKSQISGILQLAQSPKYSIIWIELTVYQVFGEYKHLVGVTEIDDILALEEETLPFSFKISNRAPSQDNLFFAPKNMQEIAEMIRQESATYLLTCKVQTSKGAFCFDYHIDTEKT